MDHGGMPMSPPPTDHGGKRMSMHMTFFWGKDSQILFSGWPGDRGGMYALALAVVFVLAFLAEWLSDGARLIRPGACGRVAAALARTVLHAVRVALAYLVMLAVMSFNGGVLVAAVAGHAVGFLFFGVSTCRGTPADGGKGGALPPMSC